MKTRKQIEDFVKKHWSSKTNVEIADLLNISEPTVRRVGKRLKLTPKKTLSLETTPEEDIKNHRDKIKTRDEKNHTTKTLNILISDNERLQKELDASLQIKNALSPMFMEEKISSSDTEATAVVLASDWHLEEYVNPATVNGMNKFTTEIAQKRVEQFFQNTLKLLKKEQQNAKIDTLVVALLGDFISGNIHEELLENCSMRPIEAIIFAENLIAGGIQFLLDNSDVNLVIPCHVGNHTRITKKVHISTEKGNSLETFMYHHLLNHFKGNERVKFLVSEGYLSYLTIYNFVIRFHHGHAIKYGGGVGGLTIPARKAVSQWQKIKAADLDCFGHFHQFFDGGNFICNGSLIGYNTFATFIKGDFEKPKQAFFLIDRKRGMKTVVCPILFDI